jgi:hypothetical protein
MVAYVVERITPIAAISNGNNQSVTAITWNGLGDRQKTNTFHNLLIDIALYQNHEKSSPPALLTWRAWTPFLGLWGSSWKPPVFQI